MLLDHLGWLLLASQWLAGCAAGCAASASASAVTGAARPAILAVW